MTQRPEPGAGEHKLALPLMHEQGHIYQGTRLMATIAPGLPAELAEGLAWGIVTTVNEAPAKDARIAELEAAMEAIKLLATNNPADDDDAWEEAWAEVYRQALDALAARESEVTE